jgi:hypothetical protein
MIRLVGVGRADIRLSRGLAFRGVRKVSGALFGGGRLDDDRFAGARVDCQRGAAARPGCVCLDCPRLMAYSSGARDGEVIVHCLWTQHDRVGDRMTCAEALVQVSPETPCALAREIAERASVHRLLVARDDVLVGIACHCDLEAGANAELPVGEVMATEIFAVTPSTTLGEAAAAMSALNVGALPVMRGTELVGVITRGDLERAGARAELFE